MAYSRNLEARAYEGASGWTQPSAVHDGLATYVRGQGPDLLLFPYPHAATSTPMIDSPLALLLEGQGFRVISFDPPGSYRSTRKPKVSMREMLACGEEVLTASGVEGAVACAGHSMGALCALAFAIERPGRVARLVLEGALSGFPSSNRHGLPGKALRPGDKGYGLFVFGGLRISFGLADLGLMRRFLEFYDTLLVVEPGLRSAFPLLPGAEAWPVPARARWTLNMFRGLDYSRRLAEVRVPTLILVGLEDLQTPPACARELEAGIAGARLETFPACGHAPHLEAAERFGQLVRHFLLADGPDAAGTSAR
jgi:proline iminopeptidase